MEDLTGKQLGPYQIISPLGEGGMAAVFKAYQPSMDRYVALKVLPRHFASDPEFIGRFSQEAKVIANLQHPHILPVHDFGEADGYTYLTMRFIEGGTLADWLKENGPLSLEKIRNIITQVGGALDYAHAQGVIHRDIKPGNILVDPWGNCLLTDFGLAKMTESTSHLTQTGGILGTPAYMSPEQGLGKKIDSRSDIYSLGVVLYQMAIGRLPYQAETPMAVVIKHIHDPLPPPSRFKPDLPEALERVILKSLAKNPEDRYATAGEMVKALQSATELPTQVPASVPEPIMPEPDVDLMELETAVSPPPQPHPLPASDPTVLLDNQPTPPLRRTKRKWIPVALGLIGLIAIVGLGTLIFGGDDGNNEDDPTIETEDLDELAAIIDDAYANDNLELVLSTLNQAIDIEPDHADFHCQLGYALNDVGDYDSAIASFNNCFELAQEQDISDLQSDAFGQIVMTEVNQTLEETDDPAAAIGIIDEATQNPIAPPWLICERAEYNLWYDNDRAVSDFEVCRQEMGDDDYWVARSEAMISMIYGYASMETEDYYSAIDHFSIWASQESDNPWPHCAIGDAHSSMHEFDPARDEYTFCLDIALEYGDIEAEHEARGGQFYTEYRLALLEGDINRALDNMNQAIEWIPQYGGMYCERGVLHEELGAIEEARHDYEICLDMFQDDPDGRSWAEDMLRSLDESN
jgi:serine/threonine protein kinase